MAGIPGRSGIGLLLLAGNRAVFADIPTGVQMPISPLEHINTRFFVKEQLVPGDGDSSFRNESSGNCD